jgi:hypothetical protein
MHKSPIPLHVRFQIGEYINKSKDRWIKEQFTKRKAVEEVNEALGVKVSLDQIRQLCRSLQFVWWDSLKITYNKTQQSQSDRRRRDRSIGRAILALAREIHQLKSSLGESSKPPLPESLYNHIRVIANYDSSTYMEDTDKQTA